MQAEPNDEGSTNLTVLKLLTAHQANDVQWQNRVHTNTSLHAASLWKRRQTRHSWLVGVQGYFTFSDQTWHDHYF